MPTISTLVVAVRADIKQFQAGMAQAEAQTVGATNTMGSGISKFGAVATVGAGIAAIALVKFGEEAIRVAADHEKTLAQLQLQVGGTTAGYEKQAQALENLTGFQHDEVLAADTVLARLHLTQAQIQGLVPAILDFAAATGTDAAGASATFEKALLGTARGLKVGGIAFKDTGTLAGNYAELIDLTSTASIKGSASLDTYAKKQRELGSAVTDLKEGIGTQLLPAMTALTEAGAKLVTAAGPLVSLFFGVIADAAKSLADAINQDSGAIEHLIGIIPGLKPASDDSGFSLVNLGKAIIQTGSIADLAQHPIGHFTNTFQRFKGAIVGSTDAATASADAMGASGDAASIAAQKEQTLAAAHDAAREAAQKQKTAEQALAGGLLGLAADSKSAADAQDLVNRLKAQGKTDTDKYRQAVLDELTVTLQLKQDLRDYAANLKEAGATQEEARQKLISLGHQFGLTRGDVLDALSATKQYTDALKNIPTSVTTDIFQTFHGSGHPLPTASGGIVTSPQVRLVGEAGPEAIIPLDKLSGGGGGITVNIGTLYGGTPTEIARVLRDELLKLGARNGTTGL